MKNGKTRIYIVSFLSLLFIMLGICISKHIGHPYRITLNSLLAILLWLILFIFIAYIKNEKPFYALTYLYPILVAVLWWIFTPTMNYLAGYQSRVLDLGVAFYGTLSFQLVIAVGILFVGYLVIYINSRKLG